MTPHPNSRAAGELNRLTVEKLVAEGVYELPELCRRAHISLETARKYRDYAIYPESAPPHYEVPPPRTERSHHPTKRELAAGLRPERTTPAIRRITASQKPTPRADYDPDAVLLRVTIEGFVREDRREEVTPWLSSTG